MRAPCPRRLRRGRDRHPWRQCRYGEPRPSLEARRAGALIAARRDDLFAVVVAAVRADAVRLLRGAAAATRVKARRFELPVRAPLAPARAGMSPFRNCHREHPPETWPAPRIRTPRPGPDRRTALRSGPRRSVDTTLYSRHDTRE